jgi:hypothetical protein
MSSEKSIIAALAWAVFAAPAGAVHFGLGSAVASQGGRVLDKAAPSLPSCGGALTLFDTAPVIDPTLASITPIGHTIPPGHVFPADHGYFNFNPPSTPSVNFYAPSDGWVVQVTTLLAGSSPSSYYLAFSPCAEVTLNFLGAKTLVSALTSPTVPAYTTCSSDNQGSPGATGSCVTKLQAPVKAGQLLGTAPGTGLDFGPLEDTRVQLSGFVDPSRRDLNRGFCPLNYFTPAVRTAYTALLGANNGATFIARTTAPVCGTVMQDVPGTAQGDWYFPSAPAMPDNPHLALVHDNVFASTITFSVGTSVPGFLGAFSVFPKTAPDATRIDYDFPLVNDGQLYCYDSFMDELASGQTVADGGLAGHIALIQLSGPSLSTLTIELQNPGTNCAAAAPWSLTGAAVTFMR